MNRRLRSTACVLALGLPIAASGATAADRAAEGEAQKLVAMVGSLAGDGVQGAAVVFGAAGDRLYLVTANHLVRSGEEVAADLRVELKVLPGKPLSLPVEVLSPHDPDLDLAVLQVRDVASHGITVESFPFRRLGDSQTLERGAAVFSIGQAGGARWWTNVAPDVVTDRSDSHLYFQSALMRPGQSGGGLFDRNWALVGLVLKEERSAIKAILIEEVLRFLRRHGYPVALSPAPVAAAASTPAVENAAQRQEELLASKLAAIDGATVTAVVSSLSTKSQFQVVVYPTAAGRQVVDPPLEALVSTDGANFAPSRYQHLEHSPDAADVLWVKFRFGPDGREIGPFEQRGIFLAAEREAFLRVVSQGSIVSCSLGGCELKRREACGWRASRVTLGRKPGQAEVSYDVRKCDGPGSSSAEVCLAAVDQVFVLQRGATVYVGVEYEDGYRLEGSVRVKMDGPSFDDPSRGWTELAPVPGQGEVPFAAVRLEFNHFDVYLGAGGCDLESSLSGRTLLYDIDGRGLVEPTRSDRETVSLPRTPGDRLGLGFSNAAGKRFGPFVYRFDAEALVLAAAKQASPPKVHCDSLGWRDDGSRLWHCKPFGPNELLPWLSVRSIHYGREASSLDRVVNVRVTTADVLRQPRSAEPPFSFEVPAGWSDVFYRIDFADGSRGEVIRRSIE